MSEKPTTVIDPVCGMTVDVARAEAAGLTVEHDGRTYAFCRAGCRRAFLEEPAPYAAGPQVAATPARGSLAVPPVIDEGMRRWYESCSCCLGDAYPEIKAQLDAERASAAQSSVSPGFGEAAATATAQGGHP
ncbi:MAG: YHS domain-containing protein [Chloroflexi bacterium]|nr:YHS domain-containing protein [Chloroflexota bacterium]